MDLRQLEYVVAVSEELNFTRAAERCHVAQSALSHQVSRLESELGQRLFERSSRSVRVTEAGASLAAAARGILSSVEDARADLDSISGVVRGRLAIGATQTAVRALDLVGLFGRYRTALPDVDLSLTMGPMDELARSVGERDLDLALGFHRGRPARRLEVRRLIERVPLVAVVPAGAGFAGRRTIRPAELAALGPMIDFRAGESPRTEVDAIFRAAGVRREIAFELGQLSEMVRFAAAGLGAAVVPAPFTEHPSPDLRPFVALRLRGDGGAVAVDAVQLADREAPAVRAFMSMLDAERRTARRE